MKSKENDRKWRKNAMNIIKPTSIPKKTHTLLLLYLLYYN